MITFEIASGERGKKVSAIGAAHPATKTKHIQEAIKQASGEAWGFGGSLKDIAKALERSNSSFRYYLELVAFDMYSVLQMLAKAALVAAAT